MRGDKDGYHLSIGNEESMFSCENNVPAISFCTYMWFKQWLLHVQGSNVGKDMKDNLAFVL